MHIQEEKVKDTHISTHWKRRS